jgi:hypothetical protein
MPNKIKRSVKSTNPFKESVSLPGDAGVFGANPAPGFRDYKESPGKVLPARKFQDTDISTQPKENKMRRSVETPNMAEKMGLQQPGTTKILSGRNRYETEVKSSNTGKKGI